MKTKLLRIILALVLLGAIAFVIAQRDQFNAVVLQQWVNQAGAAGPIIFMLIYAIGTVLFLPGSVITLAGGALFGPVLGTFYNLTGATIGATLAFLIARYLAADQVEQKAAGRLQAIKAGVEHEGWRFVAFVRLMPLFPFNLLNYALGLTRIKLSHYIIASYICMLPGGFAYTYLGYAGREAVTGSEGLIQKGLIALALLAAAGFIPRLISQLRNGPMQSVTDLKQQLDSHSDLLLLDVRTAGDFNDEQGHIAQAVNIPVEELAGRLGEISDAMHKPVYLVCRTDRRSAKAAQILAANGFSQVHVVRGGMTDWNKQQFPVK
ncbi:MAG: VTT domain-containing protein [Gammaproteobacteria bacterium]|nr:VTT domain-containing protein [Gammaproteobacteria bacterium]MDH5653761.1 VTT domain-containing protein [Gammaproteobacteria bacterium]